VNKLVSFQNNLTNSNVVSMSKESDSILKGLTLGLEQYKNLTQSNVEILLKIEKKNFLFSGLLFLFYIVIFVLALFAIIKKYKVALELISYLVLITVPLLIFICGVLSVYFFIHSDFCNSIHTAIYKDHFPIYNKRIGKIISCFNSVINLELLFIKFFNIIHLYLEKET